MNDPHNQLREKYNSFSDFEIVNIIENASQYLPHAVELAKEELSTRNLSNEELAEVLIKVNQLKISTLEEEIRTEERHQYLRDLFATSWFLLNPLKPHTEKLINILILILTYQFAESLLSLVEHLQWMDFMFVIIYLFEILIVGLAIYLLIKQNKWGWFLISFKAWNLFFLLTFNLYHSIKFFFSYSSDINQSNDGISGLINLMMEYEFNLVTDILLYTQTILWLILISSKNLLSYFSLKKSAINYTLLVALLFNVLIILSMLFT